MHSLPLQPCARCKRVLVPRGTARCPSCHAKHQAQLNAEDVAYRGTASQRGYDHDHRRLAKAQLKAKPWCKCGNRASIADHIVPVKVAPERRLDPSNLESLCRACHGAKTRAEGPGLRAPGPTPGTPDPRDPPGCPARMGVWQNATPPGRGGATHPPPEGVNHTGASQTTDAPVVLARLPPPENRPPQSAPEKTE